MAKKRIITLIITFILLLGYIAIGNMYQYGWIDVYPRWARTMIVITMIYTLGGCILRTAGLNKVATGLSVVSFIGMCVCLFYSSEWYDYLIFTVCIGILLYRASKHCAYCQQINNCSNVSIANKTK